MVTWWRIVSFWSEVLNRPARKRALRHLLFENQQDLAGHLGWKYLGCSLDFWHFKDVYFKGVYFKFLKELFSSNFWQFALKCSGVYESQLLFQEPPFKYLNHVIPLCQKSNRQGRRLTWLNRKLCLATKENIDLCVMMHCLPNLAFHPLLRQQPSLLAVMDTSGHDNWTGIKVDSEEIACMNQIRLVCSYD